MSVPKITKRVQVLFNQYGKGDTNWCNQDYILRFLDISSEEVAGELDDLDLSFDTQVAVLAAVPAGTTDLNNYQVDGNELDDMVRPILLEWKHPGEADYQYRKIERVDKLPDSVPVDGISNFEFRNGSRIYLTRSTTDVDIRVRFEGLPLDLQSDTDTEAPGLINVFVFGLCALIQLVRGGPGTALGKVFGDFYQGALGRYLDRLVKQEQDVPRQLGTRRSGQFPLLRFGAPVDTATQGSVAPVQKTYTMIGTQNGVNDTFFLQGASLPAGVLQMVFKNGIKLIFGVAVNYNDVTKAYTFLPGYIPVVDDYLEVVA